MTEEGRLEELYLKGGNQWEYMKNRKSAMEL